MLRHIRWARAGKRVGAALCTIFVCAMVFASFASLVYCTDFAYHWMLSGGAIKTWTGSGLYIPGWRFYERRPFEWLPQYTNDGFHTGWVLPLWIPIVLAGAATVFLSHLDRRICISRNYCPACDYDLSGLPPGAACPKCGKGGPA